MTASIATAAFHNTAALPADLSPDVILKVSLLRKKYGATEVLRGLSFDIHRGECFGLLGPNGAGKTTTLRCCLGLIDPDGGTIEMVGVPVPRAAREARVRVGVVPQMDNLDPDFTVRENLLIYGSYFGLPRTLLEKRIPKLLDFAGLGNKRDAGIRTLSGGMKRRLTLARALVNDPELLILDEPTTGLDPQARHLIWDGLRQLLAAGKTILLTTHFMDEAERLATRLAVIDHGMLIATGAPRDLLKHHVEAEVVEVFGDEVRTWADMHGRKLAQRVEVAGETAFCYAADPQPLLSDLATRAGVRYLHPSGAVLAAPCHRCLFVVWDWPHGLTRASPWGRKRRAARANVVLTGPRSMRASQATTNIWAVPALSARFVPVWRRNLLVWKKLAIASILGNIADPLLYMLALGYGIGSLVGEVGGMSYVAFIGTGMVCQSAMFTASFEGMYSAFSRMHMQRTWDGIINAPVSLDDVVLAEWLWTGTKAVMSTTAILAVIMILGYGHTWLAIWILPLGFVVGLTFGAAGLVMNALAPNYDFFTYFFTLVLTPTLLFSGVYFPVEQMPAWLATIAAFLPLKHAIDIARPLMLGRVPDAILLHVAVLLAYAAVAYYVALALTRRRLLK